MTYIHVVFCFSGKRGEMVQAVVIKERVQTTIELGESHFREFKSAVEGLAGRKTARSLKQVCRDIGETLVAFANADGGELLVGVEDNGIITGVDNYNEEKISQLEKAYITYIHNDTPLNSVRIARIKIDDLTVLYFSTPKSKEYVHLTSDGRCLQRKDLESVPIASEQIHFDRQEIASRQYDREFVDGPQADALDLDLVQVVAEQISGGMSAEKCLQYLDLAEYAAGGLRLRRAALLLFAREPERWHPRLLIRVVKVKGTELGTGEDFNVISDEIITGNIINLVEKGWEGLRPHLVQTRLGKGARFHATVMYPEHACREALVNAIAHRDYSQEGLGIEIFVFDDRMEVRNPGSLLSTIKLEDLLKLEGVHQSRNSFVARVLREIGYMRELGEGLRRIFTLMRTSELSLPEISSTEESFSIVLHHKALYSQEELVWLDQFAQIELDREQKAIIVLGREGKLIAPQDIWDSLGIVYTEHYRRLVSSLQSLNLLKSELPKAKAQHIAKNKRISVRQVPRFQILPPNGTAKPSKLDSGEKLGDEIEGSQARIFFANIGDATEDELYQFFSESGIIEEIFIPKTMGKTRGYGFVSFSSEQVANKALDTLNGKQFGDRNIVLRRAIARRRRSSGRRRRK